MEYAVFAGATLMLAISFPHWEPMGRLGSTSGGSRLLGLAGIVGHLGGSTGIAWLSGIGPGAIALLSIPIAASVAYTLVVKPVARSIRRRWHKPAARRRAAKPPCVAGI
jgi:hypothetical protein